MTSVVTQSLPSHGVSRIGWHCWRKRKNQTLKGCYPIALQTELPLCKSYVKRKVFLKRYLAVNGDHEHAVFCGRNGASEGSTAGESPQSRGGFPGSQTCSACPKEKAACKEERLGSCCQLGKPTLGSDRRAGMVPSPALSPLMEEQLPL